MSDAAGPSTDGWAGSIGVVTLFVDDLEEARTFYRQAFGQPVVFEDTESAVFRFGEVLVNLLAVSAAPELIEPATVAPRGPGSRFMITIHVDDVDATCADLQARGIELLNGPMDRPWGPRTASFRDPSGHIWEIAH